MGATSSKQQASSSQEQKEQEALAATTGSLPLLRNAFSKLSNPQTNAIPISSLLETFRLNLTNLVPESSPTIPEHFPQLLHNLAPSLVDLLFPTGKEGINWVDFLRGFNKCCARIPASESLNILYKLYSAASVKVGIQSKLEFDSDDDGGKVGGFFTSSDVLMLLWMCWIMSHYLRILKLLKREDALVLPDLNHLVLSVFVSGGVVADDSSIWHCNVLGSDYSVPAHKFHIWALRMVPGLAHCVPQYVRDKLQACANSEDNVDSSIFPAGKSSSADVHDTYLLTCGRAWVISLTLRNTLNGEFLRTCIPGIGFETLDNLLYRSSIHGKGLSRFWSNIEGYPGPLLILLAGKSPDACEGDSSAGRWVIGILTGQGFENRDTFYGSSGYLYAISPIFRVYSSSVKDKNFMYSHLHPTVSAYEPHPKPVGLAFGGTLGNERIFIDEDFDKVTVRHHAVDKTYQPGPLIPNQGFLPVEASVLGVEVWGLGGKAVKEQQDKYKKRELLFSDQRRKVDLKTFTGWEDSPENMMMGMVSDPNKVQREDR